MRAGPESRISRHAHLIFGVQAEGARITTVAAEELHPVPVSKLVRCVERCNRTARMFMVTKCRAQY